MKINLGVEVGFRQKKTDAKTQGGNQCLVLESQEEDPCNWGIISPGVKVDYEARSLAGLRSCRAGQGVWRLWCFQFLSINSVLPAAHFLLWPVLIMGILIPCVMQPNASCWAPCFVPAQGSIKEEQRKSPAENGSGRSAGCNVRALIKSMPLHILFTKLGTIA